MVNVWTFIQSNLSQDNTVMLMVVLDSQGSSPGRQGFMMAVSENGEFEGTIGGGIMEIKLVEKAKVLLKQKKSKPEIVFQYHDKTHTKDQSGMICSGHQVNAFVPLTKNHLELIEDIINQRISRISIDTFGIHVGTLDSNGFTFKNQNEWSYTQNIDYKSIIHILGGGHVGLALSEVMRFLGFYVMIYDDRDDLQTINKNNFADKIIIVQNYDLIDEYLNDCKNDYAVIMTVGYRTDKKVVERLIPHNFKYLGLLGSDAKIKSILLELNNEGCSSKNISKLRSPVGLNIHSKTPQEIAISIAAEIILEKNKLSPSARNKGIIGEIIN